MFIILPQKNLPKLLSSSYFIANVYITKPQMNQKLYKPVAYSNLSIDYNSWLVCCDNLEHTPRYIVKGLHEISVVITITI